MDGRISSDDMVSRQLEARGIRDPAVLAAMRTVPRERFVPQGLIARAHDDKPLPIGSDQTISQPYIVALMLEAAELGPTARVLDVGTGSGYAAAVTAELALHVVSIERIPELADAAARRLRSLGYADITVLVGDGTLGAPEHAPFDAIIAAAAGSGIPPAWVPSSRRTDGSCCPSRRHPAVRSSSSPWSATTADWCVAAWEPCCSSR
ncbi:hypothetical protein ASF62_04460 [Leifsonia sp. Leaf325]|nr:methyltransferase domain-containing protein [Leifsonia sp. Leaf325]KQQ95749.1 hypothetical protein ASF62_04460 [Leifsonia sp. Leaf325]